MSKIFTINKGTSTRTLPAYETPEKSPKN